MKKIGIAIVLISIIIGMKNIEAEVYSGKEIEKPLGMIEIHSGNNIPEGYLIADGKEVSRSEYKELFEVIGTIYGSGDGSTTFNLPNLKERVVVGESENDNFKYLGKTGGEESHKLTQEELPSHTHTFTGTAATTGNNSATPSATFTGSSATTSTISNHNHSIPALSGSTSLLGAHSHTPGAGDSFITANISAVSRRKVYGGTGTNRGYTWTTDSTSDYSAMTAAKTTSSAGAHTHTVTTIASTTGAGGSHSHTVTASGTVSLSNTTHTHSITASGTNSSTGGNQAHNNMQPYIVLKYIIKAK